MVHPRLEIERKKQDEHKKAKSRAGSRGAKARWDKKENGVAIDSPMAENGHPINSPMAENGSSSSSSSSSSPTDTYTASFEEWWNDYPRKVKKHRSFTCWKARLREGVTIEEMTDGLERYNAKLRAEGTEEEFIQHPTTFLAKGGGYVEDWKPKGSRNIPGIPGGAEGGILDRKFSEPMEPIIHERPASTPRDKDGNLSDIAEQILERAKGRTP